MPLLLSVCILTAASTPTSSLVTPIFQWSTVHLSRQQSTLALVKLIALQILLPSGRNYWFLYKYINTLRLVAIWTLKSPVPAHFITFCKLRSINTPSGRLA
jgi:hypothetical protein